MVLRADMALQGIVLELVSGGDLGSYLNRQEHPLREYSRLAYTQGHA